MKGSHMALVPNFQIETAQEEDAEALLQLQRLAYQSEAILYQDWTIPPLTEAMEALRAEFGRQLFLKASCGDSHQLVGSVRARVEGGTCFIGRLFVHPDAQGRGIGSLLMRELEHRQPQTQRFELFTGHRSSRNLSFYQHLGYIPFREKRLSNQVTLVFLEKTIADFGQA